MVRENKNGNNNGKRLGRAVAGAALILLSSLALAVGYLLVTGASGTTQAHAALPGSPHLPVPALAGPGEPGSRHSDPDPHSGAGPALDGPAVDCGAWSIVSSPSPGTYDNNLNGVAAVASNDVWAVGYYQNSGSSYQTLIEHWDGSTWSTVSSPSPGTDAFLWGVAAVASNDVWAVGNSDLGTLTEHWDGSTWSIVPSPGTNGSFNAVAAVASNDVWAVGDGTLTEHWDGSSWSIVPSPNPGTNGNSFNAVAAVASNDVWAVGYYQNSGNIYQPLIEHWNGSSWSIVSSPNLGTITRLSGVAAVASNDVWAVGTFSTFITIDQTLIEHWNGSSWSIVPSPNPSTYAFLQGVAAVASNDVWAVGYYQNSSSAFLTLTEHWNGSAWYMVSSPNQDINNTYLSGVAAVGSNDVWAAGNYFDVIADRFSTVIEHYYGSCGTATPMPTSSTATATATATIASTSTTATPVTNTGTPTRTATPNGTPTVCAIQYPDVPPGSTFYQYVHCLACRGIISGYPDGTFGPSNPVTRGQLSKIVSNSAGYTETFTTNTFEDVPVGSTFFPYVERLFLHGGIGGYPCGGVGEPCIPPANKPYFRPGANVTRGQTSKIVAIAKGLPAPTPGQQAFEDVAPNSTFWQWIEPLAATGAIGGYPCGGVGEPCVPPGNKPYFRPGANVTRGQSAKIVSNTFFPNCSTPARPGK